ncbi:hypothetical protein ACFW16_35525 [Inquilinus sp. NPDC058860]|uniref:hypothetical protein n=1 Tax=Inquilinus sp. NPDC058860 TaxID=3346652 RepID=UPI003695468D
MLSFSTEFPLDNSHSSAEFIECIKTWIFESPHTKFSQSDFDSLPIEGGWSIQKDNQGINSLASSFDTEESVAVQHVTIENDLEWSTTIVFSRQTSDTWVGVRISCQSKHPSIAVPVAKKPVIVKNLLDKLGEAYDGEFQVRQSPHFLTNNDISLASRAISGQAGCHLPVVYISIGFSGGYIVDPGSLAQKLAGMAHILVEPNRPFSRRLQIEVAADNVYGGTVGIYWPDGSGDIVLFTEKEFKRKHEIRDAIFDEIRMALLNRRALFRCTWPSTQGIYYKSIYNSLKNSGSEELNQYIDAFDGDMKSMNDQLASCEKEIHRLQRELKKHQSQIMSTNGIFLKTQKEYDLHDGEIMSTIITALSEAQHAYLPESRKHHILQDVIDNNGAKNISKEMKENIKSILRDYKEMTRQKRSELENLGFEIEDDGKHYKIVYNGDARYTFILSKTGSDHRSGLNCASDISKILF